MHNTCRFQTNSINDQRPVGISFFTYRIVVSTVENVFHCSAVGVRGWGWGGVNGDESQKAQFPSGRGAESE